MGHFYDRVTAEPRYTINGRDATLRDARKYGWIQSVNETTAIIAKPALIEYFITQSIMAALTMPRIDGESEEDYIARIKRDGKAAAKAAAEEGDRIHNAIEDSYKDRPIPDQYGKHVMAARAELNRLFPDVDDWIAEKTFTHPLGFAGKCDLHSPSTGIVVDWKSKDGPLDDGKKLAFDQNIQLAAYQVGLGLHDCIAMQPESSFVFRDYYHTQCANIFVSRTHPGCVASHVWSADDIAYGWDVFSHALNLWRVLKRYDPRY
jgi:hypothetical protein